MKKPSPAVKDEMMPFLQKFIGSDPKEVYEACIKLSDSARVSTLSRRRILSFKETIESDDGDKTECTIIKRCTEIMRSNLVDPVDEVFLFIKRLCRELEATHQIKEANG